MDGYAAEHRPLGGYALLSTGFAVGIAAAVAGLRRADRRLPQRIRPWDVLTVAAATQKLSRVIAKDKVASFIRAPFVRYREGAGYGELSEEPRGEGLRLAAGELLNCPYCLSVWIATGFGLGLVAAPRQTRFAAAVLAADAAADFMQLGYSALEKKNDVRPGP